MAFRRCLWALAGLVAAGLAQAPSALAEGAIRVADDPGLGGIVSELRGGVLHHDSGPISADTEDGVDINAEVLFTSPAFLGFAFSPRPHLGVSANTAGDTSQFYFGLSWTVDIYEMVIAEFSFGGSVHDGQLSTSGSGENELGCRVLFRESVSAGVIFAARHSLSVMFDHISNGGLCDRNDGQDTVGVRYGIRF